MPIKRIEIRWRDLDGFGHVNNSTYLTYLEEARDQYLTDVLGEAVHRTVIRHIEVDFVSGLTQADDYVDVEVALTGVGSSSVTLEERIVSTLDGRVAATARTVMVHTDETRAASAPWPHASRAAIDTALSARGEPGRSETSRAPRPGGAGTWPPAGDPGRAP
jgi:acyl-CoA thioester hydrolase